MSENSTVDDQPTFEIKPEFKPKSIRSFVIRAGRITLSQKAAFDQWWPTYGLSLHNGLLNLSVLFEREAPTVLEIGFGMGDSLLEMARNEPDKNWKAKSRRKTILYVFLILLGYSGHIKL